MPDLVTFGESLLRLGTDPGTLLEETDALDVYVGGAEGNVAVAAQRLGIDATWLSKLPATPLGRRIVSTYRSHGVSPVVMWADDGRVGTYYLERGTQPRDSRVVYDREGAAIRSASPSELSMDPITEAGAFHVTGITPALSETLAETTGALLSAAAEADTTTTFDVNYRSNLWDPSTAGETIERLLVDVDVLFVAERDARAVLDVDSDPDAMARTLAEAHDLDLVVVTLGADGALAFDGSTVHRQDAFATETVDSVGAGDAFVGGFLASWLDGAPVAEALEWGVATAALKRTIEGDLAVVTPEMVADVREANRRGIDR
ncbi:bifunctional 2-dehydro-3-deoxygluconokinase/2-dehydro-3-deoxygalactonokinase [Halorhabdus rudnickae]|uniref:bifunctional 2-dehydro-3-deoxygluconokinase/2-dehydro-3- deoxygalactonokinase n=1 Tax=Halorhabdus rudnickae TaxID=1775544 RepID=UPI001083B73D|nr:bifunctional 2-dehydro-3-deoxygluconokinase/2-dehydro-3-deoxygalactonokinase [Halorhabdus rudnickae]